MPTTAQKIAKLPGSVAGGVRCTMAFPLSVLAQASTDFVFGLPPGSFNHSFRTVTETAFTAATDCTIAIGKTAGGAEYVAATTIKAQGVKSHTPVDSAAADYRNFPATGQLNVRLAQTGSTTTVGAATLYVDYTVPASGQQPF